MHVFIYYIKNLLRTNCSLKSTQPKSNRRGINPVAINIRSTEVQKYIWSSHQQSFFFSFSLWAVNRWSLVVRYLEIVTKLGIHFSANWLASYLALDLFPCFLSLWLLVIIDQGTRYYL